MINSVKSCRKIKKTETGNLLLADSSDNMVMNSKESSFSRMEFSVSRLKLADRKSVRRFLTTDSVNLERKER